MLISDGSHGFQLDDQAIFNKEIRQVFSQDGSVLVVNGEWELLFDFQSLFPQSVCKCVFVDLFEVPLLRYL